jgi:hypothetical protein
LRRFFYPQTVTELVDAVSSAHLQVDQFFMMHIGLSRRLVTSFRSRVA